MRRAFSVATFVVLPEPIATCPLGRVLLIRHKKLGLWLPVGGEMEPNETPLEAAQRELKEETGLVPGRDVIYPSIRDEYAANEPPGFLGYEEHQAGAKGLHMNFNFVAITQKREVASDGSFDCVTWFPIGDLFVDVGGHKTSENVHYYLRRIAELRQQGRL